MHIIDNTWVGLIIFFPKKKTVMKFIILVSNLKEISPSVFSWKKKNNIKIDDAILLSKYNSTLTRFLIILTVYVLKNGVGRYNTFFLIFTRNPHLCRVRVESVNTCAFPSANNFGHAQTLYRICSLWRSTLNSLMDTRKSKNDVFHSF